MDMSEIKNERRPTGKSALALVGIAFLIVALVAIVIWALTQPGFLESVINIIAIVAVAAVIIAVILSIAYVVLGVAFYATKGELIQTGVDHSIDDIREVDGNMSDDRND